MAIRSVDYYNFIEYTREAEPDYDQAINYLKQLTKPTRTLSELFNSRIIDFKTWFRMIADVYEKENDEIISHTEHLTRYNYKHIKILVNRMWNMGYERCKRDYPAILQICQDNLVNSICNIDNDGLAIVCKLIDLRVNFSDIDNFYRKLEVFTPGSISTISVKRTLCKLCGIGIFPKTEPIKNLSFTKLFQDYYDFFNTLRGKCLKSIVINKLDYSGIHPGLLKEYEEYIDLSL